MIEHIAHFAFLAFNVSVVGASASEHTNHGLVEQMFCRMGRRKLVFVVLIHNKLVAVHTLL